MAGNSQAGTWAPSEGPQEFPHSRGAPSDPEPSEGAGSGPPIIQSQLPDSIPSVPLRPPISNPLQIEYGAVARPQLSGAGDGRWICALRDIPKRLPAPSVRRRAAARRQANDRLRRV
jgi:hypothetical protein